MIRRSAAPLQRGIQVLEALHLHDPRKPPPPKPTVEEDIQFIARGDLDAFLQERIDLSFPKRTADQPQISPHPVLHLRIDTPKPALASPPGRAERQAGREQREDGKEHETRQQKPGVGNGCRGPVKNGLAQIPGPVHNGKGDRLHLLTANRQMSP